MRKENINFIASVYAPNPKEVVYWIDLKEGPNGEVIKTYANGQWIRVNEADTSGSESSIASLTNRVTTLENDKLDTRVYNAFVSEVNEVHDHLEDSKANKATTLSGYGITDAYTKTDSDNRFVNVSGDTMQGALNFANAMWNNVGDDVAIGDYNGAGRLGIKGINSNIVGITFFNMAASNIGELVSDAGRLVWNNNTVWHAGNDGHGSGLDADLLDGYQGSYYLRSFWTEIPGHDANNYADSSFVTFTYANNAPTTGVLVDLSTFSYGVQFNTAYIYDSPLFYRRHGASNDGGLGSWQQLARIIDNVASATKLQTARTIWGQSFDGTGNVDGDFVMNGNFKMIGNYVFLKNSGTNYGIYLGTENNGDLSFSAHNNYSWVKSIATIQYSTGNVGIGTISPSYKLDVAGAMRVTGAVSLNNTLSVGSTSVFGNNVTLNGSESNNITTSYRDNGSITNIGQSNAEGIRHSLNFKWYSTEWYIGNIRGGSSDSMGFGVANGSTCYLRVNTDATRVYGNFLSTGGITCYSSDQRAKTVIEQINLSLKQIANAPTIRFKWNDWKIKDDGKTHIGGIAQYMQKLLPETVLEADDMLNMDYATTGYIFAVQTAKHLVKTDTEVERLKKRVKKLEKQLKQLGYEEANIMDD